MDILIAIAIVILAWIVFKSLTSVLIVLLIVAVVMWLVRNARY